MHTDKGRNITRPPNTHTISALGPVAAAVAVHCRLQPAVTMNRATSRTPSARVRCGSPGAELIVALSRGCYWDAVARQSRMTAPTPRLGTIAQGVRTLKDPERTAALTTIGRSAPAAVPTRAGRGAA